MAKFLKYFGPSYYETCADLWFGFAEDYVRMAEQATTEDFQLELEQHAERCEQRGIMFLAKRLSIIPE